MNLVTETMSFRRFTAIWRRAICWCGRKNISFAHLRFQFDGASTVRVADFGLATLQKGGADAKDRPKPIAWTCELRYSFVLDSSVLQLLKRLMASQRLLV